MGEETKLLRGHDLAVTCLCVTSDDKYIFTGGKDSSIIKWDAHTGAKLFVIRGGKKQTKKSIQKAEAQGLDKQTQANLTKQFEGHVDHILALAVSSDSKYLASGGRDNAVFIWDVSTCALIKRFEGHRDAVSGLAFRRGAHELYSASFDRTIKVWNLDEMTYVETL